METFEKIAEKGNPIFHIDLDPQENIKNKAYFKDLLKEIVESSNENLEKKLEKFYHKDAELNAFYPVNEIKGIGEIKNKLWFSNFIGIPSKPIQPVVIYSHSPTFFVIYKTPKSKQIKRILQK